MVTHDMRMVQYVDRVIQMVDGKAELVACPAGWACEQVIGHRRQF